MGKKLLYNRNYSGRYLVDRELIQLSFPEHGLLKIINDILWTQTDEIGWYIIKGRAGTDGELQADARRYAGATKAVNRRYVAGWYAALYAHHALAREADGTIYSPFITQEVALVRDMAKRGSQGGNPSLTSSLTYKDNQEVKQGVKPIDRHRERKREIVKNLHYRNSVPDAEAFKLRDYQSEVLNKCVGRPPFEEHPKAGFLWKIGKQVPRPVVMAALSAMQDARNNNANPDMKTVNDLEAYYFATLRNMCAEQGIETDINWNGGK